ncbi:hypothetical protein [Desulfurobacterium sp.]|nr:hypothetical protein [Desulfurobacterium sp.]
MPILLFLKIVMMCLRLTVAIPIFPKKSSCIIYGASEGEMSNVILSADVF